VSILAGTANCPNCWRTDALQIPLLNVCLLLAMAAHGRGPTVNPTTLLREAKYLLSVKLLRNQYLGLNKSQVSKFRLKWPNERSPAIRTWVWWFVSSWEHGRQTDRPHNTMILSHTEFLTYKNETGSSTPQEGKDRRNDVQIYSVIKQLPYIFWYFIRTS
jgi:hypothetical protein